MKKDSVFGIEYLNNIENYVEKGYLCEVVMESLEFVLFFSNFYG